MPILDLVEIHACLFREKISRRTTRSHYHNYEGGREEFVFKITAWGPETESLAGKLP